MSLAEYSFKLLFVGDSGVGKSSLLHAYSSGSLFNYILRHRLHQKMTIFSLLSL